MSWLDGEPWVASPDLIEFCDPDTAEPLVNTYLELGQEIAVRRDAGAGTPSTRPADWPRSDRTTSASRCDSAGSNSWRAVTERELATAMLTALATSDLDRVRGAHGRDVVVFGTDRTERWDEP